jgi:polyisoprenoid-binding protein YceI
MATWSLDTLHSEIGFKVKHLMISTVSGKFNQYDALVETTSNDDFKGAKVSFSADIESITTGNDQRDGHLKSDDFFNAAQFPKLTFENGILLSTSNGEMILKGDLTIRDVTKPIELQVSYSGLMTDFYGNQKAGFEAIGKINRKDFQLKWSATTEAGGVVVSDEVKLVLDIQLQMNKE